MHSITLVALHTKAVGLKRTVILLLLHGAMNQFSYLIKSRTLVEGQNFRIPTVTVFRPIPTESQHSSGISKQQHPLQVPYSSHEITISSCRFSG